jgi:hypothetical protein
MNIRLRDRIKFVILFYKALSLESESITVNVVYSDYDEYTMVVKTPDSENDHHEAMFG